MGAPVTARFLCIIPKTPYRRPWVYYGEVTTFSEKLWCGLLDYATAYTDGRLTFTFKNGSTFEG